MAAGNTTEARDIAHMLKGAALSVGAKRLGRIAGDLQDYIDEGDDMLAGITTELLAPTLTEFRETWKEIDTMTMLDGFDEDLGGPYETSAFSF